MRGSHPADCKVVQHDLPHQGCDRIKVPAAAVPHGRIWHIGDMAKSADSLSLSGNKRHRLKPEPRT
jgi:hypothetical protein